jgi:hypothetical protein
LSSEEEEKEEERLKMESPRRSLDQLEEEGMLCPIITFHVAMQGAAQMVQGSFVKLHQQCSALRRCFQPYLSHFNDCSLGYSQYRATVLSNSPVYQRFVS